MASPYTALTVTDGDDLIIATTSAKETPKSIKVIEVTKADVDKIKADLLDKQEPSPNVQSKSIIAPKEDDTTIPEMLLAQISLLALVAGKVQLLSARLIHGDQATHQLDKIKQELNGGISQRSSDIYKVVQKREHAVAYLLTLAKGKAHAAEKCLAACVWGDDSKQAIATARDLAQKTLEGAQLQSVGLGKRKRVNSTPSEGTLQDTAEVDVGEDINTPIKTKAINHNQEAVTEDKEGKNKAAGIGGIGGEERLATGTDRGQENREITLQVDRVKGKNAESVKGVQAEASAEDALVVAEQGKGYQAVGTKRIKHASV